MRWHELADGHTSGVENICSSNHHGSIVKQDILLRKAVLNKGSCQYFFEHFPTLSNVITG